MNYLKITVLSIGLLAVSCSIQKKESPQTVSVNLKEEKLTEIKYGPHERNVMDIYLPANRNPKTAFLVNIHGGAWTQGNRKYDGKISEYLLSQGIAVANLDYRYANFTDTHLPELLDDIDQVVKYLSAHAQEWNTRKNGFSISGGSSGAHVSMMYAYTKNPQIKTIVEMCGPVDFTDVQTLQYVKAVNLFDVLDKMSGNKTVWNPGDAVPEAYAKTSPVKFVNQIPIMIIHGDKDEVVPVQQAYILEKALKAKGAEYKLVIVPEAGHLITKLPKDEQVVFSNVAEWLKKYGTN
ncbi:prolyl oligopeptidase family protein [Elizabethkingia sp. YR214]|uniref:prolyl oligopeptidase family serine peptidase n=1 Tax=Elizabethkingia sp. YR214 TaxID=2135667 RepID=UPI000D311D32|nr:prolyl oligopeptidase family serine peptidase [Elizabethkingia sp. YR214]PUB26760.1 prolyl oligopeptidase family protein [Elizabethkingia sp. YR214]